MTKKTDPRGQKVSSRRGGTTALATRARSAIQSQGSANIGPNQTLSTRVERTGCASEKSTPKGR